MGGPAWPYIHTSCRNGGTRVSPGAESAQKMSPAAPMGLPSIDQDLGDGVNHSLLSMALPAGAVVVLGLTNALGRERNGSE